MDTEPRGETSKMLWSMVSKAAERLRRHRHDNFFVSDIAVFVLKRDVKLQLNHSRDNFCDPIALMR